MKALIHAFAFVHGLMALLFACGWLLWKRTRFS